MHADAERTHPWQDLFVGRQTELDHLMAAWNRAKRGDPQLVVLLAETGMGKTRLVQRFYSWLSQHEDAPDPHGYWSDWLVRDRNSLSVNPVLVEREDPPAIPWIWWGLRFTNPRLRNRAEASSCELVNALPLLTPHFVPLQRAKEARAQSVELGMDSMTALVSLLGMATLGPVAGGIVAALGALSALKEKVDLLRGAKKLIDLKSADDASLAERALQEQQNAVERIRAYFTALLSKGPDGSGAVPVVLILDDAQWIDRETLSFVDRLFREARERNHPLLVVCTHWEREWQVQRSAGDPTRSLAAWVGDDPDLFDPEWQPTVIGKVGSDDLVAVLASALPGLTAPQRARILERVDGNPGYLFDLVTLLTTSKRKFFEGNDPRRALRRSAEAQLERLTALDHYQITLQRFQDLDEEIKVLLAWSSYQGTRFVDQLTLEVAHRIEEHSNYGTDHLRRAEHPYALIEAVSRLSHEFRQRTIHEIAGQELREIEEDFRTFRDTLHETLEDWLESGRLDDFDPVEREQMLRLLVEGTSGREADPRVRRTLGRALERLFDYYRDNGEGRRAAEIARRMVEAMPAEGWPGETIRILVQWRAAGHLDSYLHFGEAAALWSQLIPRLEETAMARGDVASRAWLAAAYLSRAIGLRNASGTHFGIAGTMQEMPARSRLRRQAFAHLDQAIEGFAALESEPGRFTALRARAYDERALLHNEAGSEALAIEDFERAIALVESMPYAATDPRGTRTLAELVGYHTNCAAACSRLDGGVERAEAHFAAASALLRRLQLEARSGDVVGETINSSLATLHLQRGTHALRHGAPDRALRELDRGAALSRWSEGDRERWNPDDHVGFAAMQFSRSQALATLDRVPEAVASLDASIEVFEGLRHRLGNDWPLSWDSMLALVYNERLVSLERLGRTAQARSDRIMVLGIRDAQSDLGDEWTPRRRDLMVRGHAAQATERMADAIDRYEVLREDCGDSWPLRLRVRLLDCYVQRCWQAMLDEDDAAAATRAAERAVELGEEVVLDPGFTDSDVPRRLLRAYDVLALIHRETGRQDKEAAHVDRALEIARLVMRDRAVGFGSLLNDLARAHERRGRLSREAGDWKDARAMFREAVALRVRDERERTETADADGSTEGQPGLTRWSSFLVFAYFELGRAERTLGRDVEAAEAFTSAIELAHRLRSAAEVDLLDVGQRGLAHAHLERAEIRRDQGDLEGARKDCETALDVWEWIRRESQPEEDERIGESVRRAEALRDELADSSGSHRSKGAEGP